MVHRVIAATAPHARIVDLTHQVPPQDVRAGALALWRAAPYLPPCVVMAVVDPGVGTARRAVAIEVDGPPAPLLLVGPDNGLLLPAALDAGPITRVVELASAGYHVPGTRSRRTGATFAGRDVFAPAAGLLCNGTDLESLGPLADPAGLEGSSVVLLKPAGGAILAEVLWVDRFGNAQLNVEPGASDGFGESAIAEAVEVETPASGVNVARSATTYAELAEGQLGLVVDSSGLLSLCLFGARAADVLGVRAGDKVALRAMTTAPIPFGHGSGQAHP